MKTLQMTKRGVDAFLRLFCVSLFVLMIALVSWQVFVRQVLGSGDPWTEVAARVVFVWQGLIGAAYVIGEKDDVAIDFLVRKLPPAVVKAVEILAHSIVAFFAIWVMVWGGWRLTADTWDDTVQLLPISQGMIYAAVLVAGLLIALYSLYHIFEVIRKPVVRPDDEPDITKMMEEGI